MEEVKSLKEHIKVPSNNSPSVSQTGSSKSSKGNQTTWFRPCKHCGFKNHLAKDCYLKPKCSTCGSTDHLTKEHPEQTVVKRTLTMLKAQSSVNPLAKKASMIPKPFKDYSGCSRHMTGVKQYLHRYSKESGPKVVFRDNSLGDTEGYGSVNCNGITFTRVAYGTIFNQNDEVVLTAPRRRDVYVIDMSSYISEINTCFFAKASPSVNWLWHKRLSHLNFKNINNLAKHNFVFGLPSPTFSKDKNCSSYEKGKHHRASFKTKRSFSFNKCLHLLHMDLFGPVKPQTISHKKYTLVIIDEYSRKMENLNEVRVKELRSDNRTEFRNHKLEEFCDEKVKRHGKTAYDVFRGRSPDINYFHVFGCPVHIHNHKDHLGKFDEKDDDGFFLVYSLVAKAFRVFNIRRHEMEETYHVTFSEDDEAIFQSSTEGDAINFNENRSFLDDEFLEHRNKVTLCSGNIEYFPYILAYESITKNNCTPTNLIHQDFISPKEPPELTSDDDHPALSELDHLELADNLEPAEIQDFVINEPINRWSREKHIELVNIIREPLAGITTRRGIKDSEAASAHECLYVNFLSEMEPKKLIEALEEEGWIIAMQEEMNQFERNKVWTLVPKPHGKPIIGTKWIWKNKIDENEVVIKNKARLVAQGEFPNHVCKLDKALYGLKQAPRAWYETLSKFLIQHKFVRDFKGISICQEKYVKDLLKKYDLAYSASVKCPMLPLNNLGPDESGVSINETLFKGMIGSLMYLIASRSDIQFSTYLYTRYQANPKESYLFVVKRIFRYLKGTPNLGLSYPKGSGFDLKAYSDSDYAGCNLDRKSTPGGCQILGGKLVLIFCDNTSAIAISNNPVLHSRTKHIDIRYHFIRDHILKGDIELHFSPTDLQLADIFTKPLAEPSFTRLVAELVALLEHTDDLYHPMLSFLSICCIGTALTIQPFAIYVEYLTESWYTAEVEETTKTITFSLSSVEKPLSFTQDEFILAIGLPICRNVVPLPPKETGRAGLATVGLFDKDKPSLSSTVLVNSSPLKINLIWGLEIDIGAIIFSDLVQKLQNGKNNREANICYTRFLSLIFEKLLGENYINDSLTFVKPHTILVVSFQKPLASEVPLTSHMLKPITQPKAPTDLKIKKKRIPPSSKPKSSYKVRVILPKKQVAETQHMKPPLMPPRILDQNVPEEVKESGLKSMRDVTFEQIMDEIDQKNKAAQEKTESPYNTKSKIKITRGFETPDFADNDSQEGTAETFNASADMPAQSDPLGHLHKELCILNTKVDQLETSISKKVIDDIQSSVLLIVTDTLNANLLGLLLEALKNTLP
ncbi:retrovirus-related pol polyprotein from transposon TNT 1-94 [Tanacetum coccineum]|uniref:Retrovirus-related pol polyprotein from transposon TNT 1-94 n=1 Tax=Tanacetum coccineum TaxID=301880 RepID=A0ABQ5C5C2_9ASTR